ncbi:hypothetical protein ACIRSU_01935 [Streptomyces sp. NPDC101160]|uniref:hypothetical protein n=1 Tax=Streptomyces sp. NPDC101160 TaxID=3366118 RepID=UPI003828E899
MTSDAAPRTRPLHQATATATATGSALAVALLPVVVGALLARSAGGDPMASVNALITGGGPRTRLSRATLRGCGDRAVARARGAWGQSPLRTWKKPCGVRSSGPGARTRRAVTVAGGTDGGDARGSVRTGEGEPAR